MSAGKPIMTLSALQTSTTLDSFKILAEVFADAIYLWSSMFICQISPCEDQDGYNYLCERNKGETSIIKEMAKDEQAVTTSEHT
jgi:hypothetical protein